MTWCSWQPVRRPTICHESTHFILCRSIVADSSQIVGRFVSSDGDLMANTRDDHGSSGTSTILIDAASSFGSPS